MRFEEYQLKNGEVLPLLQFPFLDKAGTVKHGFTTRLGGVSLGDFSTLNLSFSRGDDPDAVRENFHRVAEALDASYENFIFSDQQHHTNVRVVGREDAGSGLIREKDFFDVDGMITNVPGLVLSTFYADCVPLYFVDPVHKAIGLSHSGWKGTVGRMGAVTVEAMAKEYGTRPSDLLCAIGPSICKDCYEVSFDVAQAFQREFFGHISEILVDKGKGKFLLDLWRTNEIILEEAGVPKSQIEVADFCTCENSELLFSHRASHGKRGNLGAFLSL